jgi:hypothetical protein
MGHLPLCCRCPIYNLWKSFASLKRSGVGLKQTYTGNNANIANDLIAQIDLF